MHAHSYPMGPLAVGAVAAQADGVGVNAEGDFVGSMTERQEQALANLVRVQVLI